MSVSSSYSCTSLIPYSPIAPDWWRGSSSKTNKVKAVTTTTNVVAQDKLSKLPQVITAQIILFLPTREIALSATISHSFKHVSTFAWRMLTIRRSPVDYGKVSESLLDILEKSVISTESGEKVFDNRQVIRDIPRVQCPLRQSGILSRFLVEHATAVHHEQNQEFNVSRREWQQHEYVMPKLLQLALENHSVVTAQFIMDTTRSVLASQPHILGRIRELPNIKSIKVD